jgi:hypothetical protein
VLDLATRHHHPTRSHTTSIVLLTRRSRVVDDHHVVDALLAAAAADLPRSSYIFRSCTHAIGTELNYQEIITTATDKKRCIEEEYHLQSTPGRDKQAITIEVITAIVQLTSASPLDHQAQYDIDATAWRTII